MQVKLPFSERLLTYIYSRRRKYKLFDIAYKFMYSSRNAEINKERKLRVDNIHDEFGENLPYEFDQPLCHVRDDVDPVGVKHDISNYSIGSVAEGIHIPGFKVNNRGEHIWNPEYKPEIKLP